MSVTLSFEGDVAIVTLARPQKRNALDEAMWVGIRDRVLEAAAARPRVLIVTGEGGHFSSGMDFSPTNPLLQKVLPVVGGSGDLAPAKALITELKSLLTPLGDFPAPTIAAIEGACIGGGFEVALWCDVRIASRDAIVGLPEVRMGMVPDVGGTTRLTRLVGPGRAARVILGGERYSGQDAFALGLVEQVVEPGQALAAAHHLAREIQKGGPRSVANALGLIRRVPDLDQAEALAAETEAGAGALASGEPLEGMQAFVLKRDPAWPRG